MRLATFALSAVLPVLTMPSLLSLAEDRITVQPQDNGRALVNPLMGWTFHHYSNIITNYGSKLEPSDTLDDFPGLSVIYLRLPWAFIEEEEGVFNWSIVDTPAQRWIDKGLRVAFRFTCSESWMEYATPRWVEQAGAKGYRFTPGKGTDANGPYWEPDFNDPIFLEKLEHFLAAAARRYDGHPDVDFIDVGSMGVWGEAHTFASTRINYSFEVIKKHIDLYTRYFKKTLLAINDDFAFHDEKAVRYAFEQGMTLRDDSILVQAPPKHYFHADLAQQVWRNLPVILENEHYGASRDRGNWGDGSKYLEAIEDYHAAYASIHWWPREFLSEQSALIDQINRRLGYRLQPREISWPKDTTLQEAFTVKMTWANAGVAPCYPGGFPAITLKDAQGGIVAVFTCESFDVKSLEVGPKDAIPTQTIEFKAKFARNMRPGTFEVFLSVGRRDGTPVIALPLDSNDGHRRYKLGQIEVREG